AASGRTLGPAAGPREDADAHRRRPTPGYGGHRDDPGDSRDVGQEAWDDDRHRGATLSAGYDLRRRSQAAAGARWSPGIGPYRRGDHVPEADHHPPRVLRDRAARPERS